MIFEARNNESKFFSSALLMTVIHRGRQISFFSTNVDSHKFASTMFTPVCRDELQFRNISTYSSIESASTKTEEGTEDMKGAEDEVLELDQHCIQTLIDSHSNGHQAVYEGGLSFVCNCTS